MSDSADRYYTTLAADYATTIRQLVPDYDAQLDAIAALVDLRASRIAPQPCTVLDLGAGTGEAAALLLRGRGDLHVTAVEPGGAMLEVLRDRLQPWADRTRIVATDALGFPAVQRYHAVVSNLVMHNLGNRDKRKMLRRILALLEPGGVFVWGDMIRRADQAVQRAVIEQRTAHARAAGCAESLITENFRKEAEDDSPWTVLETLIGARRIGFRRVDCTWSAGAFAVFALWRGGR